jgi:hypothetical protein
MMMRELRREPGQVLTDIGAQIVDDALETAEAAAGPCPRGPLERFRARTALEVAFARSWVGCRA